MKKLISLLFLLGVGVSAFAQKSYVNVSAYVNEEYGHYMVLSGDVPSGMQNVYSRSQKLLVGDILNMLSSNGFEVELMSGLGSGQSSYQNINFLLSKKSSSNGSDAIQHIAAEDDSEVYEVARYNLQGIPISKNEKGIQIVVFSNYTTKTIIKE